MSRARALSIVGVLALAACTEPPVTPVISLTSGRMVAAVAGGAPTSEHVFVMNSGIPTGFADAVAQSGGAVVYSIASIDVVVTTGLTDAAAGELARGNGKVERDVSVNWVPNPAAADVTLMSLPNNGAGITSHNPATAGFFAFQWNMKQIQAHTAWAAGAQASGVRVAILDTGLDDRHPDQAGLIDLVASKAFVPSLNLAGPPWNDDNFHGTHVGSIVVANGIGVSGVAPHATLIAVKVLDAAGNGSFGNILAGIVYATDVGADVINLSLGAEFPKSATGGGQLVAALNRAINYAHQHDVVVVSAAGNLNHDLQHNGSFVAVPCESGVGMCVSATGPTQAKASYSNYGSSAIAVAAPGGDFGSPLQSFVLGPCSTYSMVFPNCQLSPRYVFVIGTSQAAPHVSGVAALMRARGLQGASQIITTIGNTSDDLGKPGTDQMYGRGRINSFRAWTSQ